MEIIKIDTSNMKDVSSFIRLPFDLYMKNKNWVPPFPAEMQLALNREKHPFYAHSTADFFIARSEKEILGRIAVIHNQNYCNFHQEKTAFFYYFESIDDESVARELLGATENWAKSRALEKIIGGKGLLRSNGQGILVTGFESYPAMGSAYNFQYYDSLIQKAGYTKETDFLSGALDHRIDPKLHQIAEKVRAHDNFSIKSFSSKEEMIQWVPRVDEVHHRAFAPYPNFYPSTVQESELISKNIIANTEPDFIKLIMHREEIAGFIIAYPDINHALQQTHGAATLLAMADLLAEKKLTRTIDLIGLGLLPEYQGLGGNALLYSEVEKVLLKAGKRHIEIVQVDERNLRSKNDMETMGVVWNKTHRTYVKNL